LELQAEVEALKAQLAETKRKGEQVCKAVENEEEHPPAKFALRCLMAITSFRGIYEPEPPEPKGLDSND
jgi:hypothetical protein